MGNFAFQNDALGFREVDFGIGRHLWQNESSNASILAEASTGYLAIDLHGATPHIFRHTYMTFAQRVQMATKTLQTIGGYVDPATLQDRYVHTRQEDIEAARIAIDSMFVSVGKREP